MSKFRHTTNKHKKAVGTFNQTRHGKKVAEKIIPQEQVRMELIKSDKFTKEQVDLLNDVINDMKMMGILRDTNLRLIEMLCIAYLRYHQANQLIERDGLTITLNQKYGDIIKVNPALEVKDKYFKQFTLLCDRLGLDPKSQSKINQFGNKDKGSEEDEF